MTATNTSTGTSPCAFQGDVRAHPECFPTPLDGCITKAPSGGECAGPSPADRAKDGIKRSQVTDGYGIPLGTVAAPANRPDHTLLDATLDTLAHIGPLPADTQLRLDAGYDNNPARDVIDAHELTA